MRSTTALTFAGSVTPASLRFQIRRIIGSGNLWVAEHSISYDGGPWYLTVSILEFRGDKMAHERIYITQPWEAAEWRAQWRAAGTAV
jgi:hypothetical protein